VATYIRITPARDEIDKSVSSAASGTIYAGRSPSAKHRSMFDCPRQDRTLRVFVFAVTHDQQGVAVPNVWFYG
jgi:hypothetical protein